MAGKAQVQAKAKGTLLETPALPLQFPVTVQFLIDDGVTTSCWESEFSTALRNDAVQVKAKGPVIRGRRGGAGEALYCGYSAPNRA